MAFTSNSAAVQDAVEQAFKRAGEIIGGMAESFAKHLCHYQTGLLRNSITHALGGGAASTGEYHADSGDAAGSYSGTAQSDPKDKVTVYIGSNVFYAPFVELGTRKAKAYPFLAPAIQDHIGEYQEVFNRELAKIK